MRFELVRGRDYVLCAWCAWTSNPLARSTPSRQVMEHVRREHRDTWKEAA